MQINRTKAVNISISLSLAGFITVLLRTLLLLFGFDFELKFFASNTLAYTLYAVFLIALISPFFLCKKLRSEASPADKSIPKEVFFSLLAAVFFSLGVIYFFKLRDYLTLASQLRLALKTVSYSICLPTAFLSSAYYVTRLFSKKNESAALSLLATCPSIFLASFLIRKFAEISASASSLYYFPDIIALLVLAFFILDEGKSFIPNAAKSSKRHIFLFASPIALSFSALPDLITVFTNSTTFGLEDAMLLVLKLVFLIYTVFDAIAFTKSIKESTL